MILLDDITITMLIAFNISKRWLYWRCSAFKYEWQK